jgi:hypothetical protein
VGWHSTTTPPQEEGLPIPGAAPCGSAASQFRNSRREIGAKGCTAWPMSVNPVEYLNEYLAATFRIGMSVRKLPPMPPPKHPSEGPNPASNAGAAEHAPMSMLTANESFLDSALAAADQPSSLPTPVSLPKRSPNSVRMEIHKPAGDFLASLVVSYFSEQSVFLQTSFGDW